MNERDVRLRGNSADKVTVDDKEIPTTVPMRAELKIMAGDSVVASTQDLRIRYDVPKSLVDIEEKLEWQVPVAMVEHLINLIQASLRPLIEDCVKSLIAEARN